MSNLLTKMWQNKYSHTQIMGMKYKGVTNILNKFNKFNIICEDTENVPTWTQQFYFIIRKKCWNWGDLFEGMTLLSNREVVKFDGSKEQNYTIP